MKIDAARQAAPMATAIDAHQSMVARIQDAVANGWLVSELWVSDPATGSQQQLVIAKLSPEISAQCLAFAMQIYQDQLDALNAQLAAL